MKQQITTFYRLTDEEKKRLRGACETGILSKTVFADKLTEEPELKRELAELVVHFLNEVWENGGEQNDSLPAAAELSDFLKKMHPETEPATVLLPELPDFADEIDEDADTSKEKKELPYVSRSRIGEEILLGTYRGIPLKWKVISCGRGKMLVLCESILEKQAFIKKLGPYARCSWETSDIRKWLNKDFYNEAFTQEEQKQIRLSWISNRIYSPSAKVLSPEAMESREKISAGRTKENVFLLSKEETERYLKPSRRKQEESWWLRSPSPFFGEGMVALSNGTIVRQDVTQRNGVRPAMWISAEE
ncbi:MAG: hypothetical protein IJ037_13870 [Clostridia bacterium]|nr:hypothetical protein [Clostridia bacterium]